VGQRQGPRLPGQFKVGQLGLCWVHAERLFTSSTPSRIKTALPSPPCAPPSGSSTAISRPTVARPRRGAGPIWKPNSIAFSPAKPASSPSTACSHDFMPAELLKVRNSAACQRLRVTAIRRPKSASVDWARASRPTDPTEIRCLALPVALPKSRPLGVAPPLAGLVQTPKSTNSLRAKNCRSTCLDSWFLAKFISKLARPAITSTHHCQFRRQDITLAVAKELVLPRRTPTTDIGVGR
jgi:hypothetical protein